MAIHTPAQLSEICCANLAAKTKRSAPTLLLLSVLAGAIIALGSAATNTAIYGITDLWTARTICALIFPFGLGCVMILGAELFTGNCLMPMAVLDGRASWAGLCRNWVLVYLGNLLGAGLVAWICVYCGQLDWSNGYLALYTMQLATTKSTVSFGQGVGLGILCNLLVAMGVMMAMSAQDTAGKLLGAYLPVALFVLCGFEHCVANMYYILAGLMAAARPDYAALAAAVGMDLSGLDLMGLVRNLVPVTLGNILGGAGLGVTMWYCHMRRKEAGAR